MRNRVLFAAGFGLALGLSLARASAEPATPEGAKAIAARYAAYLSAEAVDKGFVTVTPDGGDYVIGWDLQKALAEAKAPVQITPFTYRLTPTVGDGWTIRATALPSLSVGPTGDDRFEAASAAFEGFRFDGLYDPAAPAFFRGKLGLGEMKFELRSKTGDVRQRFNFFQQGLASELTIKAGAEGGVDVSTTGTLESSRQDAFVQNGDADAVISSSHQGAGKGDAIVSGLRAGPLGDIWKFLVAHADTDPPPTEQLKPMIVALLPLWREMASHGEGAGGAMTFPGGSASLKFASQDVELTGLVDKAAAGFGFTIDEISLDLPAGPDWVKSIWPVSLALRLDAGVDGLDRAAQLALDDPEFLKSGALGDDAQDHIVQGLLAGHPHASLSKTRIATALGDATFEGEASLSDGEPQAHARVTAADLEKLLALLSKIAETQPVAQQALLMTTFARGLARNENGRLVWDIDYVAPNAVKVNGQIFPPPGSDDQKR